MDMAESHVVSALANKRVEIAGMIARTQQQLGQFRADLVHLDATIRLFAPTMEPETIPAKRIRQSDPWFERGELSRGVLDALRRAGTPIRAPDLVRAVMIDNGLDPADRASFIRVQCHRCVRHVLRQELRRAPPPDAIAATTADSIIVARVATSPSRITARAMLNARLSSSPRRSAEPVVPTAPWQLRVYARPGGAGFSPPATRHGACATAFQDRRPSRSL